MNPFAGILFMALRAGEIEPSAPRAKDVSPSAIAARSSAMDTGRPRDWLRIARSRQQTL